MNQLTITPLKCDRLNFDMRPPLALFASRTSLTAREEEYFRHYYPIPAVRRDLSVLDSCPSPTPNADLQAWTNQANQHAGAMNSAISQLSATNLQMGPFARAANDYATFGQSLPSSFCIGPSNQSDFNALNSAMQNANNVFDQGVNVLNTNFSNYSNSVTPLLNNVIQASSGIIASSRSFRPVWDAIAAFQNTNNRYSVEVWTVSSQIEQTNNALNALADRASQAIAVAESQIDTNVEAEASNFQQQERDAEAAFKIWDADDGAKGYDQYISIARYVANILIPDFNNFLAQVPDSPRVRAALQRAQSAVNQIDNGLNSFPDFSYLPDSSDAFPYTATYTQNRRWGLPKLIDLVGKVCVATKNETNTLLRVNDLSYQHGGHAKPHKSHRDGNDVDVTPVGMGVVPNEDKVIALAAAKRYLSAGATLIFFADQSIVNDANTWASTNGVAGRLQFEKHHTDHFHLRISI